MHQGKYNLTLLRRIITWSLRPLHRFLVVRIVVDDPWEPASSFLVSHGRFGSGSTRPFAWYFEGQSTVSATTVDQICDWLAECQYIRDRELFLEPDYWQHPLTFEQLRRGDCEDHALWAWRKLHELGIPAELFVGQWGSESHDTGFHAWVVFERDGQRFLLESVIKQPRQCVRLLEEARAEYVPHYSVDTSFHMCARSGLLVYWREQELNRRAGKGPGQAA